MRKNNRLNDELRSVSLEWDYQAGALASVLITMGGTQVLCAVSLEESVPPFLKNSGKGWLTAEYGMLPCATSSRGQREAARGRSGRTYEIQRLIGRSLRMMTDLTLIGERTLRIDCDVLNADAGTRTASITGAALALRTALTRMHTKGLIPVLPPIMPLAAVSVGLVAGEALLDLDYVEDKGAEADANFVMTADNRFIEVQISAEGRPFSRAEFDKLAELAASGIGQLLGLWEKS
ncbi:MAG: ribonuclease PH [Deltaproteobacteria bacterium RIFOXYD12_FULL_50_9]|nr:MAG: ribonuclease PH [Deltaproteobacteria bacterium RIFOXYD12_FULL_50_9]